MIPQKRNSHQINHPSYQKTKNINQHSQQSTYQIEKKNDKQPLILNKYTYTPKMHSDKQRFFSDYPKISQVCVDSQKQKHKNHQLIMLDNNSQQIKQILIRQNNNLKQHCDYLICEVRKCNQTIMHYKTKIKKYKLHLQQKQIERDAYKMQSIQMKEQIFSGINRIEHIFNQSTTPNQYYIFAETKKNINNIEQSPNSKFKQIQNISNNPNQFNNLYTLNGNNWNEMKYNYPAKTNDKSLNDSTQPPELDHYYLDELSDKFQSLMKQYQINRNQQIRKKCIEIAKQIKNIKIKLNNSQGVIHNSQKSSTIQQMQTLNQGTKKIVKASKLPTCQSNNQSINLNHGQVSWIGSQINNQPSLHVTPQKRLSHQQNNHLKSRFQKYIYKQGN